MPSSNSPFISIIMPTYNRGELIIETIRSIQQQSFSNWELVVVDDGSTDDTLVRVHDLHDQRIQFHQKRHSGITGLLKNEGMQIANGDFIAFMDSDDIWMPNKLELQINALDTYKQASYCMTGGFTFHDIDSPEQYYYQQKTGNLNGKLLESFFRGQISALMPSLLMKRHCYDQGLRFEEDKTFSDNSFILTLASKYEGVVLYDPLLGRRLHAENITNQNWELGYTEYIDITNDFRKKGLISGSLANEALVKTYINYGEKCVKFGQRKKARKIFLEAIWKNPLNINLYKKLFKTFRPVRGMYVR